MRSIDAAQGGKVEKVALRDRSRTEAALRGAVLQLLEEGGVLAGVNLQEVSERAGVNRGLVYQYFGNRRELLRSALREAVGRWVPQVSRKRQARFVNRVTNAFRAGLADPWMSRLVTLLVLDGDREAVSMPLYPSTHASFLRDVETGSLAGDVDVEAIHVLIASIMHGYTIHRTSLAQEVGVSVTSLDRRVEKLLCRLFSCLEPSGTANGRVRSRPGRK